AAHSSRAPTASALAPHSFCRPPAPRPGTPPLSLHDALPIYHEAWPAPVHSRCRSMLTVRSIGPRMSSCVPAPRTLPRHRRNSGRSEEHTSELQSREKLVCRLLLEKKKTLHSAAVAADVASAQ